MATVRILTDSDEITLVSLRGAENLDFVHYVPEDSDVNKATNTRLRRAALEVIDSALISTQVPERTIEDGEGRVTKQERYNNIAGYDEQGVYHIIQARTIRRIEIAD